MKIQNQRLVLEAGDEISLAFPNGQEFEIDFQNGVPQISVGSSKNNGHNFDSARGFRVTPDGKMEEYQFD